MAEHLTSNQIARVRFPSAVLRGTDPRNGIPLASSGGPQALCDSCESDLQSAMFAGARDSSAAGCEPMLSSSDGRARGAGQFPGHRFKSCLGSYSLIVQMAERKILALEVGSSNLPQGATLPRSTIGSCVRLWSGRLLVRIQPGQQGNRAQALRLARIG